MRSKALSECIFCNLPEGRVFLSNELALALWDAFPVTKMHALVIPRRHTSDFFTLTKEEIISCSDLLGETKEILTAKDPSIEGFNIGLNVGSVAGQTIFHCHFHLIPRRRGDVENPRGGVRHLIPGKGFY